MGTTAATTRGAHEARYLAEVHRHLTDLPRRQQADLLDLAAANLDERPTAGSWDGLVAALGPPSTYAAELRAGHELPAEGAVPGRLAATRGSTWAVLIGVTIAVAVIFGGYLGWDRAQATADPGLQNSCAGVVVDDPAIRVERLEAGGVTEHRLSYVDGAEVGIGLCLSVREEVELLGIDVPGGQISLYEQIDVRTWPAAEAAPDRWVPLDRVVVRPDSAGANAEVLLRLTGCEHHFAGSHTSFDTAEVHYRYRGRNRTETVGLNTTYSVVSPPDPACPRARTGSVAPSAED